MKYELCTLCNIMTNNWTYVRQRIVCRTCWELMGSDEGLTIISSSNQVIGEEE